MDFSVEELLEYNVIEELMAAPKKPREKYGARIKNQMSQKEQHVLNKERNREHAKSTRLRRKIFAKVSF